MLRWHLYYAHDISWRRKEGLGAVTWFSVSLGCHIQAHFLEAYYENTQMVVYNIDSKAFWCKHWEKIGESATDKSGQSKFGMKYCNFAKRWGMTKKEHALTGHNCC